MRHALPSLLLSLLAVPVPAQDRPFQDALGPHVRGSWEAFTFRHGGTLHGTFDAERGVLREARGALRVAPRGIDATNAAAVGRVVLRRLAPVLGTAPGSLVERGVAAGRGGLFQVAFAREHRGVPVRGAHLVLRLSAAGDLLSVRARGLVTELDVDVTPAVSRADAALLARVGLPGAGELADAFGPELLVLPEDGGELVWRVAVTDPELVPSDWHVLLDARSGVTLSWTEAVVAGDVSGKVTGFGTPTGTMELSPEAELPLTDVRVRVTDYDSALATLSTAPDVEEALISPDGSRVFWTTRADGDLELWTAAADGSGALALTDNTSEEYDLATDHAGSVVFFTSESTGDPEIFRIDADGSGLTRLTTSPGVDRAVSVPYDGLSWYWESDRDGDLEIYRSSGGPAEKLTDNTLYDGEPEIGGDGTKLAFLSGPSPAGAKVWSMNPDGTAPLQLVFGEGFCADPSITAAGDVVLFERWRRGRRVRIASGGPTAGAGAGYALPTPQIWSATTDGTSLAAVLAERDSYQVDPFVAGGNGYAAWAERTEDGDLDVVHVEFLTGATLTVPLAGDQTGPTLSADGRLAAFAGGGLRVLDLRPGAGSVDLYTDAAGGWSTTFPDGTSVSAETRLAGAHVRVTDEHPGQEDLREVTSATAPDGGADMVFNDPGTDPLGTPQVTAYHQHSRAHDHLEGVYTALGYGTPLPFDAPLAVRVNDPAGTRNAFYSFLKNEARYFVGLGPDAPNTCFDTVAYHEYGHYVDEMFGQALGLGGLRRVGDPWEHTFACSEGIADWISLLTSGTDVVGAGWAGAGTWVRNYDVPIASGGSADRQWDCLDCDTVSDFYNGGAARPESHQHGEALAGFGKDLRDRTPAGVADTLLLDAVGLHPVDMRDAVAITFDLDLLHHGGAHFDALCKAARRHGFDCPPRPDFASHGCHFIDWCGPMDATHLDTGPERLGMVVDSEPGCEAPDGDEDGLDLPIDTFDSGETITVPLTLSVDGDLLDAGRYGGVKADDGGPNPLRYLYVNAWILVDAGEFSTLHHVTGTGSGAAGTGVPGFAADTFAVDPDADWGGAASETYPLTIALPEVADDRVAILRLRLDYGEDGGRADLKAMSPLNDPLYSGDCGPSRSGEVEDYQILLVGK